ncbi:uncharacterized protein LOC135166895 [Diachasmimorpha longicaudata]|uniref:uncharacterized protein LOC135166895 n=1 Tax=Diachasmimorpha longicaudata TaxID=58733 RepID=UPI0030B8AD0D
MSDNIKVAIKVRPLIKREERDNLPEQWAIDNNKITQFDVETKKRGETEYSFDYIFDQKSTNEDVFKATVLPVVEAAMRGFNGTIFAYGQTSSGKTYTMMGTQLEPGVIPLAVTAIFDYIMKDETREFVLSVSYIELYNEKVNDLLDTTNQDLKLREENGEVKVDCKEEVTHSVEDILRAMKRGQKNRRIGETHMNDKSSRSHTIFRIMITSVLRSDPDGVATVAQLNLIDLAGSERAKETGATGDRFKEGKHINLSLSTLGLVINQLSESQIKCKGQKGVGHISYRDSKLTRILQSSLGGNSLTTIICAVTPAAGDETSCTLAFAQRAKGIKNKPKVNETGSDEALVKKFRRHIHRLEGDLKDMSKALKEEKEEKQEKLQIIDVLKGRIELLRTKILSGDGCRSEGKKSKCPSSRRRTWGGPGTSPSSSPVTFELPTIQESVVLHEDPEEKKKYMKRRQSVFRNVKLVTDDESFSTNWEDFELQLIKDEEEKMARWSCLSNDSVQQPREMYVDYGRHVEEPESGSGHTSSNAECPTTPTKSNSPNAESGSPETPKTHLRHQITDLCIEYNQLRCYTTLEKQLRQEDAVPQEPMLEFIQKSLLDSEQVCKDINKKYSELKSEYSILTNEHQESLEECEKLRRTVESLTSAGEQLPLIESERNLFKAKFEETTNKLKILEDETSSHAYAMELLVDKHKLREKELEKSLNAAWEELKSLKDGPSQAVDSKSNDNDSLKLLISKLTTELTSAGEKIEGLDNENKELKEQVNLLISKAEEDVQMPKEIVDDLNKKIEDLELALKLKDSEISELRESISATNENEELKEKLNLLMATAEEDVKNHKENVDELGKRIEEFELTIKLKDSEISQLKESLSASNENEELKEKLNLVMLKAEENVKNQNEIIDDLNKKIEDLELTVKRKELEISELQKLIPVANETEELNEKLNLLMSKTEENEKNQKEIVDDLHKKIETLELTLKCKDTEILHLQKLTPTKQPQLTQKSPEISSPEAAERPPESSPVSKLPSKLEDTKFRIPKNISTIDKTLLEESIISNTSFFNSFALEKSLAPTDSVFTNDMSITANTTISTSLIDPDQSLLQESLLQGLLAKTPEELISVIDALDKNNRRLMKEFQEKALESEEIKNYVSTFKADVENLRQTVMILTNENAELTIELEHENVHADEIKRSLEKQVKNILEEKRNLETLNKSLNNSGMNLMEFSVCTGDDLQVKIDSLTAENGHLSSDLMEKLEELEEMERKFQIQKEKCQTLEKENEDLSNNLMEKIEDYERIIQGLKDQLSVKSDSCKTCGHLAELIQTRRALKLEVKSADKKLEDLREDFERRSVSVGKLQEKAKENMNISGFLDDTIFSGSILEAPEGVDAVSYVEEKVQKLHSELEDLRTNYDSLTTLYNQKCQEIETLSDKKIDQVREEVQRHRDDLQKFKKCINNVSNALEKFKDEKSAVEGQLEALKEENKCLLERVREGERISLELKAAGETNETLKETVDTLSDDLRSCRNENGRLVDEISSLKAQVNDQTNSPRLQELEEAKSYLKKEITSLQSSQKLDETPVIIDLIKLFITTIMAKESEIIQTIQSSHKKEKLKLEEEKKQLVDAEKRSMLWAKELEADVERLQNEISTHEAKKSSLEEDLSRFQNLLKELKHEKNLLDEKVRVMEADYVVLQSDLEKYSKGSFSEDSKSLSLEEHEKILHEALMNKDIEHSSKVHQLEERHRMKIEELENSVDCLKTKNMELRRSIEGLEANKENYQAIIDLKGIELDKSVNTIDRLEKELEEASVACDSLRRLNDEHLGKVKEVTELLKVKCDKLSEMKNQIQGMTPEYERLKDESLENQSRLEKYKTEIEFLRGESSKQKAMLDEVQDAMKSQEIKSAGLEKQLAESKNLNEVLQAKLHGMEEKIEALTAENESLVRKIRNSTSKLTAERDLEDLRDESAGLKRSLEGASNRILELQTQKSQLLSELTDLKSQLTSSQSSSTTITTLQTTITGLQSQLEAFQSENMKLKKENEELDKEMDLMLQRIEELDNYGTNMERKYWDLKEEKDAQTSTRTQDPDYNILREKYDKLSRDFQEQVKTCDTLTKENVELKLKINDGLTHPKSNSSSRSASPTPSVSMRRKRRSDIFNQNRPQELAQEFVVTEERECNCESLRKTNLDLEHQLVLKKGKITALEMKIAGLCVPYKKKCEDYQEMLDLAKQNIQQLQKEVSRLREDQGKASNCEKCKYWRDNRRDAETQCIPEVMTGFFAPRSGIVADQVMVDKKIEKLEKEKDILKNLCRSRRSEIYKLDRRVKELELLLQSYETVSGDSIQSNGNMREELKENVPSNIMGQSISSSSRSYSLNQ